MLSRGGSEFDSAVGAATRHFALVREMFHRISLQISPTNILSFANPACSSIGLLAQTPGVTDQPLNLCLRDQEFVEPIIRSDKNHEHRLLSFDLFRRLSHSSAFSLLFNDNLSVPVPGTVVGRTKFSPALTSSTAGTPGTLMSPCDAGGTAKGFLQSESLTRHHRRRGWKGLAVCAACHWAFDKMSDLNLHYTLQHREILVHELTNALLRRQRRQSRSSSVKTEPKSGIDPPAAANSSTNNQHSTTATTANLHWTSHKVESDAKVQENTQTVSPANSVRKARKGHMCPRCNYCAKWPTELQKHVVVHATIRPFACMICGNRYKWSWDLGRHFSAVHTSLPNPYKFSRSIKKHTL